MRVLPFSVCVLLISSPVFGAGMEADSGTAAPVNVAETDWFWALEHGGGIYVGTVTKVDTFSEPGKHIEQGKVTLAVSETLWGSAQQSLILPYMTMGFGGVVYPVWTFSPKVGPEKLLLLVVPNGTETYLPKIPETNAAACRVVVIVAGKVQEDGFEINGDGIKELQELLKLYAATSASDLIKGLPGALNLAGGENTYFALDLDFVQAGQNGAGRRPADYPGLQHGVQEGFHGSNTEWKTGAGCY